MPRGNNNQNAPWVSVLVASSLNPNNMYRIVAAGDNGAKDLDIRVLDPQGNVVAEDNLTTAVPEVTFRPSREQDYTIQLRLYNSTNNSVCVGAILTK